MALDTRPNLTREAIAQLEEYLTSAEILDWEQTAWPNDDWSTLTEEELEVVDEYFQMIDGALKEIVFPAIELQADVDQLEDEIRPHAVAQVQFMLKVGLMFTAAKAGDFAPWLVNVLNQDSRLES